MKSYQSILITGASSGIGAAFARALAAPQRTIIITGRDQDKLIKLAKELENTGGKIIPVVADLRQTADIIKLATLADQHHLDLLINNAGLGHVGEFKGMPIDHLQETLEVNVIAATLLMRLTLPAMLSRATPEKRAGVIMVASMAAFFPMPYFAAYAASKSYLYALTLALRQEYWQKPIDFMALCPGFVKTAFMGKAGMPAKLMNKAADPHAVVHQALKNLGRKGYYVNGWRNKLSWRIGALIPASFRQIMINRYLRTWLKAEK